MASPTAPGLSTEPSTPNAPPTEPSSSVGCWEEFDSPIRAILDPLFEGLGQGVQGNVSRNFWNSSKLKWSLGTVVNNVKDVPQLSTGFSFFSPHLDDKDPSKSRIIEVAGNLYFPSAFTDSKVKAHWGAGWQAELNACGGLDPDSRALTFVLGKEGLSRSVSLKCSSDELLCGASLFQKATKNLSIGGEVYTKLKQGGASPVFGLRYVSSIRSSHDLVLAAYASAFGFSSASASLDVSDDLTVAARACGNLISRKDGSIRVGLRYITPVGVALRACADSSQGLALGAEAAVGPDTIMSVGMRSPHFLRSFNDFLWGISLQHDG